MPMSQEEINLIEKFKIFNQEEFDQFKIKLKQSLLE